MRCREDLRHLAICSVDPLGCKDSVFKSSTACGSLQIPAQTVHHQFNTLDTGLALTNLF